tara:strand:- start:1560 stop:1763 length:204 start_codon:yes stop_codon:yes gene_type:complete
MIDPLLFPTILSITIQGLIGIISQIQHSRCSEIRVCGMECKREVPKEQPPVPEMTIPEIEAREVINQ